MKWQSQIKAQFMLVCMLLGMLHNAIPHEHEPHPAESTRFSQYTPQTACENVEDETNFLAFLLEIHTQSNHSHEYTPATLELVKTLVHLDFTVLPEVIHASFEGAAHHENAGPFAPRVLHWPKTAFLNQWPLRGPPLFA